MLYMICLLFSFNKRNNNVLSVQKLSHFAAFNKKVLFALFFIIANKNNKFPLNICNLLLFSLKTFALILHKNNIFLSVYDIFAKNYFYPLFIYRGMKHFFISSFQGLFCICNEAHLLGSINLEIKVKQRQIICRIEMNATIKAMQLLVRLKYCKII